MTPCIYRSGWFRPGEAERAAACLGLTLEEFFTRYMVIDWWDRSHNDGGAVFVLRPALEEESYGNVGSDTVHGVCSLYRDGVCRIAAAPPTGCVDYQNKNIRRIIADAWDTPENQNQIKSLLGYCPHTGLWGRP